MRDAFRELHGTRLHGFALLLTLGDRAAAARLAAEALAEGVGRVGELRHPVRGAAWLRAHVVRASRVNDRRRAVPAGQSEVTLTPLGVDRAVLAGLSRVDHLGRAALIAGLVERFDRGDVATIVGRDGARLDRLLRKARESYAAGHMALAPNHEVPTPGPMVERIRDVTRRALQ
ncbi:MAG: hypothetical protein ABIW50_03625 [Candidatus Limnocylindria bacterium]